MIASTHVFRFRSYRDAARSLLRDRARMQRVGGLRFHRLIFVGAIRTEGFTIGIVEPRRHMALCIWESEEALEQFLQRSPIGRRWLRDTDQYCELRMRPFRGYGTYHGHNPVPELNTEREREGPVAMWTFANIPVRSMRYIWTHIRHATQKLIASPGLVAGTAGPEHLYRGAMTFTIWETLPDAVRFAYHSPPHKQIVRDVNKQGLLTDSLFIRFQPYAATGKWPAYSRFADRFDAFAQSLA